MNEPKRAPSFFASLIKAGTDTVRENYARRLGRAWARGYIDGVQACGHAPGTKGPAVNANPYVDDDGQPRRNENGEVILPD